MPNDNREKIINYIDFIKRHPRELKYFSFDEGRKFIVDGNKIKMLPTEYAKLYNKDEFYISIDPDEKTVIYYAFDVEDYISNEHKDEALGYFEWDRVVDQIYAFLTVHLKELTTSTTPFHDISEKPKDTGGYLQNRPQQHGTPGFSGGKSTSSSVSSSPYTGYYDKSYKEREAFCSKVTDLLKEHKTSGALDHINDQIVKMCQEKKFEDIDAVLRWISVEKLNIPIMIKILDLTRGADHILKERKDFYGKVRTHIMKIKPARADWLLRNLEPGKEYKDVVKYEAK